MTLFIVHKWWLIVLFWIEIACWAWSTLKRTYQLGSLNTISTNWNALPKLWYELNEGLHVENSGRTRTNENQAYQKVVDSWKSKHRSIWKYILIDKIIWHQNADEVIFLSMHLIWVHVFERFGNFLKQQILTDANFFLRDSNTCWLEICKVFKM